MRLQVIRMLKTTIGAAAVWVTLGMAHGATIVTEYVAGAGGRNGGYTDFVTIAPVSSTDAVQGQIPIFMNGNASFSTTNAGLTNGPDQTNGSDGGIVSSGQGFCSDGTYQIRLRFDLGQVLGIKEINSYTWHNGGRLAQNIWLYGALGTEPGLNLSPPGDSFDSTIPPLGGTDPASVGWTLLGSAVTNGVSNGQLGVSFRGLGAPYRYLLFDIGQPNYGAAGSYFGEIDVVLPEPASLLLLAAAGAALPWRRTSRRARA